MSEPESVSKFIDEDKIKQSQARSYLVIQHNDLIRNNRYTLEKNKDNSLSLLEQKIILYLVSKIKPDTRAFDFMEIDIKEFSAIVGIANNNDIYSRVKEAITKLLQRVMWLKSIEEEISVRWIEKAKINKGKGKVYIKLDDDLRPYLIGLYSNYTRFPLHSIIRMKSKYGIMLYEILRSYYYQGSNLKFSIDDLKERLDCLSYTNFTNFKRKVIEPALRDINEYSELFITVEYVKQGRTYTDLIFSIRDLEKPKNREEQIEAARRYYKVEQEIDKDQISLFDLLYSDEDIEVEIK